MADDTDILDLADRVARAIRGVIWGRGVLQSDGSYLRADDAAIAELAEHVAAELAEQQTGESADPAALEAQRARVFSYFDGLDRDGRVSRDAVIMAAERMVRYYHDAPPLAGISRTDLRQHIVKWLEQKRG
jgi:hypothetical protein